MRLQCLTTASLLVSLAGSVAWRVQLPGLSRRQSPGLHPQRRARVPTAASSKGTDAAEEEFDLMRVLGDWRDRLFEAGKDWQQDPNDATPPSTTTTSSSSSASSWSKPQPPPSSSQPVKDNRSPAKKTQSAVQAAAKALEEGTADAEAKFAKLRAELSVLKAQQKEAEEAISKAQTAKELTMKLYKLEIDLRDSRRLLKEVQNIRRDLAYRLEQAQKTLSDVRRTSQEDKATIQALRQRESALVADRDQVTSQLKTFIEEVMEDGDERHELMSRLSALNEAAAQSGSLSAVDDDELKARLDKARKSWGAWYTKTFSEFEKKVQGLEMALVDLNKARAHAEEKEVSLVAAQGKLDQAREQVTVWQARTADETKKREVAERSLADTKQALVKAGERAEQAQQQLTMLKAEIKTLTTENREVKAQREKVTAELNAAQRQLDDTQQRLKDATLQFQAAQARVLETEKGLKTAQQGLKSLQEKVDATDSALQQAVREKDEMLGRHSKELKAAEDRLNTQTQQWQQAVTERDAVVKGLEGQLRESGQAMSSLQADVQALQAQIQEKDEEQRAREAEAASADQRLQQDLNRAVSKAEAAEAQLQRSVTGFRKEITRLHTERYTVRGLLSLLLRAVFRKLLFRRRNALQEADVQMSLERSGFLSSSSSSAAIAPPPPSASSAPTVSNSQ